MTSDSDGSFWLDSSEANRLGRLTDHQRRELRSEVRSALHPEFLYVLASLAVATVTLVWSQRIHEVPLGIFISAYLLSSLGFVFARLRNAVPLAADTREGSVESTEGHIVGEALSAISGPPHRLVSISVGGMKFTLSRRQYDVMPAADKVRIYFLPRSRRVVGLEPHAQPQSEEVQAPASTPNDHVPTIAKTEESKPRSREIEGAHFLFDAFSVGYGGADRHVFQDAWAANIGLSPNGTRVAIADGATMSPDADRWARSVAWAYAEGWLHEPKFWEHMNALRRNWTNQIPRWHKPKGSSGVGWWEYSSLERGAFTSLVGLDFVDSQQSRWHALAVGDSSMFQIRAGKVLAAFPMCDATAFTNHPTLICSLDRRPERGDPDLLEMTGTYMRGDSFLLMTDALAQWFLAWRERRECVRIIDGITTAGEFVDLVNGERSQRTSQGTAYMHDDDTTLVRIRVR